nr:sulfurtransferase TusA family protein [Pseudovibrio stylochi]
MIELDLLGLKCPLPVMKTRQRLARLQKGDLLKVLVSDPMTQIDIPHMCQQDGYELIDKQTTEKNIIFVIRR